MNRFALCLVMLIFVALRPAAVANMDDAAATRYLAFQIFTAGPSPNMAIGDSGMQPLSSPSKDAIKVPVQDIIGQIGMTGNSHTRLAFVMGPLAFDHTDAQLRQMIADGFDIALELNIAVGFHIDDSIFWSRRTDLWHDTRNIEWLDWNGTPNTGRRLDWGPQPAEVAPQMCFNSPAIQAEVTRLAEDVIGSAIEDGVRKLEAQGRADLFAGVIAGWETQIGLDFDTGQNTGYCALSNRGFSRDHRPENQDAELEQVVQEFIGLWANGLHQAGIDPAKIYSHTAFAPQIVFDSLNQPDMTYSRMNNFAPPDVAFGANHQPGFSTYPQAGLMEQLYDTMQQHDSPAWASAEGSTVIPAAEESVIDTESYLAWMFNHGAVLVNIFGWGVGDRDKNPYGKAADNPEAIAAYRKFLHGEPLIELATDLTAPVSGSLPVKIQQIQADLPVWLAKHPERQSEIALLMQNLDTALKEGRLQEASDMADAVLQIIGP